MPTICTRRPTIPSWTVGLDASLQDGNRHSDVRYRLHPFLPLPPRRQKYLRQAGHPRNVTALSRARKAREMQSTRPGLGSTDQLLAPVPAIARETDERACLGGAHVTSALRQKATRDNPADGWSRLFVGVKCRPTSYPDRSLGSITIVRARSRTPAESKFLSMRPDAKSLYNVVCLREASRPAFECSRHALTIKTPSRRVLRSWTSGLSQACGQISGLLDDTRGGDKSAHTIRRTSEPHTARAPTFRHDKPHHRGLHCLHAAHNGKGQAPQSVKVSGGSRLP